MAGAVAVAHPRMPAPPAMRTKRAVARYKESVREVLEAQDMSFAGCSLCGETFVGNAFEVIQQQAKHREEVHGLAKTNVKRKAREAEREEKPRGHTAEGRAKISAVHRKRYAEMREQEDALIIGVLREHGPCRAQDIARHLAPYDLKTTRVKLRLRALRKEGRVNATAGNNCLWRLVDGA